MKTNVPQSAMPKHQKVGWLLVSQVKFRSLNTHLMKHKKIVMLISNSNTPSTILRNKNLIAVEQDFILVMKPWRRWTKGCNIVQAHKEHL